MKKIAVCIAAVILSAFCSVPAAAAGHELPEETTIGVLAKAVYTLPDGCYGAEAGAGGEYIAALPDGTRITLISGSADPSLRVVIVPITAQQEQAYPWLSGCTAGLGTDPLFYDIYFIDEYGVRVDVNRTFEVRITLRNGGGTLKTAEISAEGRVSPLASKSDGNTISFTIEKGGYYVVAAARIGHTGLPVSPETGDDRRTEPWIALLFISGAGAAGAAMPGRRKRHPVK